MRPTSLGWNDQLETLYRTIDRNGLEPARVLLASHGSVTVATETHDQLAAAVAGALDARGEPGPPAVGDWVAIDRQNDTAIVRAILPRCGVLTRRRPGRAARPQVVAANVDLVLLVDGLDRGPNLRRIERGVALAWDARAKPLVVLTKADLHPDPETARDLAAGAAPFAEVLVVSATSGTGVDDLRVCLVPTSTAVLLGPSGAGKSTLVNRLLGSERLATAEVRPGDRRGRHTTTRRELVPLPGGACLIDTAGVRELGMSLDGDALDAAFADIAALARGCRFSDCRHQGEPGCAVVAAAAEGGLDPDRLGSYIKLWREAEAFAVRHDEGRRHERRAKDRVFGRLVRAELRRKGYR